MGSPLRRFLATVGFCVVAGCSGSDGDERAADAVAPSEPSATIGPTATLDRPVERPAPVVDARVELAPTGNRVIEGTGTFTTVDPAVVAAGDRTARWILPTGTGRWTAVLDDGSTVVIEVDSAGAAAATAGRPAGSIDVAGPPPIVVDGDVVDAPAGGETFSDALPDTRVVTDGERSFALGGPSDRYAHGVLGDIVEATSILAVGSDGRDDTIVTLDPPDVFEAVSPTLADVDGDGELEVVATVANASTGARIVAYDLGGSIVAETPAVGRGNRWRNLLAVAPVGPNGEIELVDVQTPHIGGILQFFRAGAAGRFELVASTQTYSTHSIGSRNLDLGIVTDADGDGRLDVLLPSQDQRSLAVVTRDASSDSGVSEIFRVDLGARVSTNLAAANQRGSVGYAVGLDDGRILVWPASA